jgi:hypothetical protein
MAVMAGVRRGESPKAYCAPYVEGSNPETARVGGWAA